MNKMEKLENKRKKLLSDIERSESIIEKESEKLSALKEKLEVTEYEITAALMVENDLNLDQLKELLQMDGVKELLTPTSQNTNSYSEVQEQSLAEEGV
ncbi:hypothetical protein [Enterococcus cecorum]|uniref:Uncharacterized protein n=1 Tax=Enterococcus cecorum DSM 20682 = ATCC 43198 TaxID=1121864 RepID=S1RRP4_9ENTE|nr:hypothetical protein [Enterococcus cecorum]EOX19212.1 hypothetical protein I567_00967 [Enterococcus cecorum DSM 20682 = ATCC 43198]ESK62128.1 hypothetical protein OMO_01116 [Enterococcus cecorum DSM 20682 = ATCC 43198]OJG34143.1 hypothetical protein RT42_GL001226 [Enterococcus cecorum DSM 20682 = ATCC 43198]CAI3335668.1 hypothetical protein CIRMBP1318_00333 [Enterococcus cecorum DSM 20682 = ATCC 43198]SQE56348.1 Uncharacterised protein [Enterococcus cecorum]